LARTDTEAAQSVVKDAKALCESQAQPHNSIDRSTATTGEGRFAPYSLSQLWFHPGMQLDIYAVLDENRISTAELAAALTDIGKSGYGRDASIGLGKFRIVGDAEKKPLPCIANPDAFLTLAPCAPQGLGFDAARSFYQVMTRFGRHGVDALSSGNPFKRPVLLAKTGGVFVPKDGACNAAFIGQGLGNVSTSLPETVAQGYAPVIGIRMENA